MSCIDAAIIKALVEHIGIDPEDVPVGSPHECVKYTAGEGIAISGDNVISATDSCKCVKYTAGNGIAISGDNVISSTNTCRCPTDADEQITNVQFGTIEKNGSNYISISRAGSSSKDYIKPGVVLSVQDRGSAKIKYCVCVYSNTISNEFTFFDDEGNVKVFTNDSSTGKLVTDFLEGSYTPVALVRMNSVAMVKNLFLGIARRLYWTHQAANS